MRTLLFALLLSLLMLVGFVHADIIRMADGESESVEWITTLSFDGQGGSISGFSVYGGAPYLNFSYDMKLLQSVEFRYHSDAEKIPLGRSAHLTSSDDRKIYHATAVGLFRGQAGFVLRIRQPGVGPTGPHTDLPIARIKHVRFSPPRIGPEEDDPTVQRPPTALRFIDPNATPEPARSPEELLEQIYGAGPTSKPPERAFIINPMPQTNPFSLEGQGVFLIGGILLCICILTFFVGTFVLMYSAKSVGINDLTLGRAIVASALLSFIPPGLFFVSAVMIPLFIALKLFAGLSLFYISARIILMGFLEVLEDKATEVMISFYAVLLLIAAIGWGIFVNMG
jgi:hypothetical protein